MMLGATRTLLRRKEPGRTVSPIEVTWLTDSSDDDEGREG
jgi:hypothetical protein